ncbi:ATP-dependent DNA helicase RecG [Solicola sp. PLA-1-18]|uniref:ATP-dependent DNA helicase RecG n=1 Tax=Solicola sp. PLA-1-18 TaxID=3380532 RepID=UPI003B7BB688
MTSRVGLGSRLTDVVGGKAEKVLAKALEITSVEGLLRHYPRRYVEHGELTDLSELEIGDDVTVMARVESVRKYPMKPRGRGGAPGYKDCRHEVVVTDGSGRLALAFFRQPWLDQRMRVGSIGLFAGKVSVFNGRRQLAHPEHKLFGEATDSQDAEVMLAMEELQKPLPIYAATAAITTWTIRDCIGLVLDALDEDIDDPLPREVRDRHSLMSLVDALHAVHRPVDTADHVRARERLKVDEAFLLQTVLAHRRAAATAVAATTRPPRPDGVRAAFLERLPFTLTAGQQEVLAELDADLVRPHPMQRLLQGEVGSGKTIVALLAMLQVVDAGGQAALLAPTEVLAQQHHRSMTRMLGDLAAGGMLGGASEATRVRLLTGSMGTRSRREAMLDAASGEAGIVVGTHALLEDKVQFADLGLVVIDEQHRFGVEQRAALSAKAATAPHVLVMTATPIPRTVAMTAFGDLETSVLSELPAGRQPIQSSVVPAAERPAWLARAWERVREEVEKGRQAYVVCPRIGDEPDPQPPEDGERPMRSVVETYDELVAGPLEGLRVAVLHGRMTPDDKDATMTAFAAREIDVLVATTVVEVGVDVPNATAMVVMDADRFGVSQLHQLRGRVGRGSEPGLCLLVTDTDAASPARVRLDAVASTTDGFALARLDVELRREGDVLGAQQSGVRSSLKLLSVIHDEDVIAEARDDARAVVASDPTLADHPALLLAVLDLEATTRAEYLEKS